MEINYIKFTGDDLEIQTKSYVGKFEGLKFTKYYNSLYNLEESPSIHYRYNGSSQWMKEFNTENYQSDIYYSWWYKFLPKFLKSDIYKFEGLIYVNAKYEYVLDFEGETCFNTELTKVFNYSKADEFAEILNRLDYNIFVISADDFRRLEESFDNKNPANKVKTKKFYNLDYDFDFSDIINESYTQVASLIKYYELLEGTRYARYDTNLFIISTKPIKLMQ